jgi:diguanylate cyclase (GGDEF)-like protein/PAS domain S-box-containing protein
VSRALQRDAPDFTVDAASTLQQARELLINYQRFDLALVDLRLPDGNGFELVSEIRERELPIAIVMLTGSGDQQAAIAALQSGADDYIPKGVDAYSRLPAILSSARHRFTERTRMRRRRLRVLYAEHDAADIDLTRRHLERSAPYIRLTVVPDAVIALSHLPLDRDQPCEFDVVLLDYRLPGIDALEAVKTIRQERGLDVPIVIVSGQGDEQVASQAMQIGVDDYIAKHPGYLYELAPTLEKVHRQAELLREQAALKQASRHLGYMLEASPVVLYTMSITPQGNVATWVSANITRLFGFSEEEVLAPEWWLGHLHPDDLEQALGNTRRLMENGHLVHEYRFFDKDGAIRWIRDDMRLLPSDKAGVSHEVLGAWHDTTASRQSEQIQQTRLDALDSLVRGEPLNSVLLIIAQRLESIRPEMRVSILLRNPTDDCLYTAAAPSLPEFFNAAVDGLAPEIGNGSCGTAAATGQAVIVDDVHSHPYWQAYLELTDQIGVEACWSIPFKDENDSVIGTIGIYHGETRAPKDEDLHLIGEFARIAGLAVQRANAENSLRLAAAVFDSTTEGVVITDLVPRIIAVNRAYTEITGFSEAEIIGCNPGIVQSGRQDEAFYQALWTSLLERGHWQGEIWNRRKNGEIYPQLLTISTVRDSGGAATNYVGVMTDISQIKQSEANLERLAHYDPLTGLPNRLLIQSRVEHALAHARREGSQVAILFVDLDRFKNINDSLGHPVGDRLLQQITQRIDGRVRGDDTFGRLGGDEFLIVLEDIQQPGDAAHVAREVLQILEAPFSLQGYADIYIGASIGISLYPQDGEDAAELVQYADAAMYQAKEKGRNTLRFYTPELSTAVTHRMELESRMRRALAQEEFTLHYQPQVELPSSRIMGCEALVRWRDPDKGLVSPADFIPLAEETGLIVPLGDWVIRTACAQFRRWVDTAPTPFCMAINLSARQLQQPGFVDRMAEIIAEYQLPAERIKLELTESMIMASGAEAVKLLGAIKGLGVRLSIDDFGTGYSSLAYLKRFPIDELKIDRGFVKDIPQDENDAEIAATIIAMAHNLRLTVVAEGVETEEQAAFLARHGCQAYQGFLFHPPLEADAFDRLLHAG